MGYLIERKAFLRSFVKRIEVNRKQVIMHYHLPMPRSGKERVTMEVLLIVTPGGPNITFAKPMESFFELSIGTVSSLREGQCHEPSR